MAISFTKTAPLLVIAGPTGSGKSGLSLHLAGRFPAEIVSCDSVQIYRGLDIGTAKASKAEQEQAPHHMLDIAGPEESLSAGDYARRARTVLRRIASAGRLPIVAGGTGFYLRALLEGLFDGPSRDDEMRRRLAEREQRREGSLHRLLSRLDPAAAARIHARDVSKLTRALEVRLVTGRPISQLFEQGRDHLTGFRWLKLGLDPPRDELYRGLDARTRRMFHGGLVEEVGRLLAQGVPAGARSLQSLGYRQALAVLGGESTLDEAIESTQQATRQYAKRQWTWFRRDSSIRWLPGFGTDPEVQAAATRAAREFLQTFAEFPSESCGTFPSGKRIS